MTQTTRFPYPVTAVPGFCDTLPVDEQKDHVPRVNAQQQQQGPFFCLPVAGRAAKRPENRFFLDFSC
jgi:hypothetical protein